MDFDLSELYFSRQQLQRTDPSNESVDGGNDITTQEDERGISEIVLDAARRHFREFLRKCSVDYVCSTAFLLICFFVWYVFYSHTHTTHPSRSDTLQFQAITDSEVNATSTERSFCECIGVYRPMRAS